MGNNDEMPEYLRNFQGSPGDDSNFGPDDVMWTDENRIDLDEFADELFGPKAVLRELLLAIARAHPSEEGESNESRLDRALSALIGGGERRRGRKSRSSDDAFLIQLARLQFLQKFGFSDPKESMRSHVRKALERSGRELSEDEQRYVVDHLIKKYKVSEDKLLSAISLAQEREAHLFQVKVDRGLGALREIGIIPNET